MEDLGGTLEKGGDVMMLGGGNPAHIPEVEAVWRRRLGEILAAPGGMESMLGDYDTPRGRLGFLEAIARFFNAEFGWNLTADNVAVTTGSQTAFFMLFNLFAGADGGLRKKILFPLVPEYIGYSDQGIAEEMFTAWKPEIEFLPGRRFKYRINFGEIPDDIAAVCLSRPTNPTANVITAEEMERLAGMVSERGIHLIVDNAYGQPFPGVIYRPETMVWNERVIHTFSLSKLGLPGTRTGIVVAAPEIIRRISAMNAVLVLATSSIGQTLVQPLLESGEMGRICREVIRPFYHARSLQAQEWIGELFGDSLDYHVHVSEGAFFLWLWFHGLPGGDRALYERLKARNVIVVPGSYFFPGLREPWAHTRECVRVSYCCEADMLRRGLGIIAEEARRAYGV